MLKIVDKINSDESSVVKSTIISAPVYIPFSPHLKYSGSERVAFLLNQGFHNLGINSYIAGPADADTGGSGTLVETLPESLQKFNEKVPLSSIDVENGYEVHYNALLHLLKNLEPSPQVILDFNIKYSLAASRAYASSSNKINIPVVVTVRDAVRDRNKFQYSRWIDLQKNNFPVYVLAVSNAHKNELEETGLRVDGFVYNGLNTEMFDWQYEKQDYLFWIGHISKQKGTELAVEVARKTGRPLILAGKPFSEEDIKFYNERIKPYLTLEIMDDNSLNQTEEYVQSLENKTRSLSDGDIHYVNIVDHAQKNILYKHASAMLMPNRVNEAIGGVLLESWASGTPVIGSDRGSLHELIKPDVGFSFPLNNPSQLIDDMSGAVEIVSSINPLNCRTYAENNFSQELMARNYLTYFDQFINS